MERNQRQGETRRIAASEYLAAIVDSSYDAIVTKSLEGIVTSWNPAAEQMFGYTAEEMIGRPIALLAVPEVVDEIPKILERIRQGERVDHYETLRRRKDGRRINVSLTISPVRDASGKIIGASKIARDVTELKRVNEERAELLERERAGREAAELAMRLHSEAERNLGLLVDASDRLLGSLEGSDVLARTLELAQRFVAADAYAVWRLEPGTRRWRMVSSAGLSDSYSREETFTTAPHLDGSLIAIEDLTKWDAVARRQPVYEHEQVRSLMVAPMLIHGEWGGTLTFYFKKIRKFPETERRIATALANLAASAISSAEVYQEQKRLRAEAQAAARRSDFLAQASVVLGSTLHFETTLDSVAGLAVPGFADWCAVDLLTGSGVIERLAVRHIDPEKIELAHELRRRYPISMDDTSGLANVLRTGKSELYADLPDHLIAKRARDEEHLEILRKLGLSSVLLVPMIARGKILGAITFVMAESGRHYAADDLAIAEQLAMRAALAIDNANLYAAAERDRSELQVAVNALSVSNAELQQFAYVSSHDLQEPLRTMASFAQLLALRYKGRLDADADDFIDYIVDGAIRMSGLIDSLLSYSRLVRMGTPSMEKVNAEGALVASLRSLTKSIAESGAVITHDALPSVLAHGLQLTQVFQNLIGNAIKYRRDTPPKVHVAAALDVGEVRFSVRDNGIGISPEYWEHVFGLFKRLHGREIPGTGIGLATCKKIIEQHGGRIWLESVPGEGTTFYFTVTAAPQPENSVRQSVSERI